MKAWITRGISASGKTTWAEQYCKETGAVNINRDDIRFWLFCDGKRDWSFYKFTKQREKEVTEHQHHRIKSVAWLGLDIVISDTNINPKTVASLTEVLQGYGYEVEIKDFWIDVREALKRDAKRENGVGYEVIMGQYKRYCEVLFSQEYHQHKNGKKDAVIFDIDGTIAKMHNRTPFEWNKVGDDLPVSNVISLVHNARYNGMTIIFLSGRDAVCMQDTMDWLDRHVGVKDSYLFMRCEGDTRRDTVVKKEIFYKYINNNFNIHYVVDDRPCIIRTWLFEVGLAVFCVGNPYVEF